MNLIDYFKNNEKLLLTTIIVFVVAIIVFVAVILIKKYIRTKRAYKEQLTIATETLSKLPHTEAQNDLFLDPVLCEETKKDNQSETVPQDEVTCADEKSEVAVNKGNDVDDVKTSSSVNSENTTSKEKPEQKTSTKNGETASLSQNNQKSGEDKNQSAQKQTEPKTNKFTPTRTGDKNQVRPVKYSGKWLIYRDGGRYGANLVASNGEVLLRTETYTALSGIKSGIETIKNNVEKNNFAISVDKNGNFFFKLYSSSTRLLCISEGYSTKSVCESAIESVKRFSKTAVIEIKKEEKPDSNEA